MTQISIISKKMAAHKLSKMKEITVGKWSAGR
jgi:hypothetical protein